MKKIIILIFAVCCCSVSCSYLDMSPDQGIQEEDIFTSYNNSLAYFQTAYYRESSGSSTSDLRYRNIFLASPLYLDMNAQRYSFYIFTDAADTGRSSGISIKRGMFPEVFQTRFCSDMTARPIFKVMFEVIRISNKTIANAHRILDATQAERDDLIGQAYFVRGFAYFTLCCYYGGMPYMTEALGSDDEWDLPRLSAYETFVLCARDFEAAHGYMKAAGKMRRDGKPGEEGHLAGLDTRFPNGVAAKAMQGRSLLFAASKLYNQHGTADWVDAAEVCAEAIEAASEWGYDMMPFSSWSQNFVETARTNEQIWALAHMGKRKANTSMPSALLGYPQTEYANAAGTNPTQNYVDKFETKWGDPLETEADRAVAIAAGHYHDQNPYANRDPRFSKTIVYDGLVTPGTANLPINIYYNPTTKTYPTTALNKRTVSFGMEWYSQLGTTRGYSNTGYYLYKFWSGQSGNTQASHTMTDPIIRVAELYLNYAEAVNEAYGPSGTAGALTLTAVDAVNVVRTRAGMPDVLAKFTGSADAFRERIYNERNVEFAFEGHCYYRDSRRWKTCETAMAQKLYGMYIESCPVDAVNYPKGRKYIRRELAETRQSTWQPYMYYFSLPAAEANKMKNFVNNPYWN